MQAELIILTNMYRFMHFFVLPVMSRDNALICKLSNHSIDELNAQIKDTVNRQSVPKDISKYSQLVNNNYIHIAMPHRLAAIKHIDFVLIFLFFNYKISIYLYKSRRELILNYA